MNPVNAEDADFAVQRVRDEHGAIGPEGHVVHPAELVGGCRVVEGLRADRRLKDEPPVGGRACVRDADHAVDRVDGGRDADAEVATHALAVGIAGRGQGGGDEEQPARAPHPRSARHSASTRASASGVTSGSVYDPMSSRLRCQSSVCLAVTASGRKRRPAAMARLLSMRP